MCGMRRGRDDAPGTCRPDEDMVEGKDPEPEASPWQDLDRGVGVLLLAKVAANDSTCATARLVCRRWAELAGAARRQLSPSGGTSCREIPKGWASAFPELHYLDLSALPDYQPDAPCVSQLSRLRSLHMPLMARVGSDTWLREAALLLPSLTSLDLSHSACLWDSCLDALRPLTGLRSLALNHTLVGSEDGMRAVGSLKALTNLEMNGCRGLTDGGAAQLGALSDLRSLDLSGCNVSDSGMSTIAAGSPRLSTVSLSGSERLTGRGLSALARCPSLKALEAPGCPALTDEGVQALAGHLRELRTLNLGRFMNVFAPSFARDHCALLTDEALASIGQMTSLTALDLEGNRNFTDSGVGRLGGLEGLTQLYMSNCKLVTDGGLALMLRDLKELRELHLAGFSSLSDEGLTALLPLWRLESVILSSCRRLTDGAVQHLLQLPELWSVHLHGCHSVSPTAVQELQDHGVEVMWYALPNEWVEYNGDP